MGNIQLAPTNNNIVVASLNYSGLLNSPFQFFSSDNIEIQQRISQRMKQSCIKIGQGGKPHQWKLGKIDKEIQKQRFSPLYMKNCGLIKLWEKCCNEIQFMLIWEYQYTKFMKVNKNLQFKPQQKEEAKVFDYLCYQAIWKQCGENYKNYEKLMENFFSKPFLNQKTKLQKALNSFKNKKVDILFLQQSSKQMIVLLKKQQDYIIIQPPNNNSIIAIKKSKFNKIYDPNQQLKKIKRQGSKLYWNQDTAIAFVDNLILFSIHLSSKKQKNTDQINQMLHNIIELRKQFPQKQIIVGGDANNFVKGFYDNISKNNINIKLFIVPKTKTEFTCKKKRTYLQPQTRKAQEYSCQVKDSIISSLQIQSYYIRAIEGVINQQMQFLPSEQHPFDHLVVVAFLKQNKF